VINNNLDSAIRKLNSKLERDGFFGRLKELSHFRSGRQRRQEKSYKVARRIRRKAYVRKKKAKQRGLS
jgi:ribosomal protein S21